jgi:hypothetical protein
MKKKKSGRPLRAAHRVLHSAGFLLPCPHGLYHPFAHQRDVHPQGIAHVGVDPLRQQAVRLLIDTVETGTQFLHALTLSAKFKIMFQEFQFAVQQEYLPLHLPGVHGRKYSQQWIEHTDHGEQQDQQAVDQRSQPEGEMLLQERAAL